ncbi:F-box only protein 39-like [Lineus longissimus]|uniref:F-box only protein 39-like n=1 Tax=Lineus longissimus TaxID=88925 RepID=UPI002B4C6357
MAEEQPSAIPETQTENCNTDQEDGMNLMNLTDLPDLVLVKIMSYLGFNDLYSAALTCQRMNEIMNHPAAWSKIRMDILSDTDLHNENFKTSRYLAMTERYGAYFQDLEFYYTGYCQPINLDIKDLIDKLNSKCRLKSLVISVYFVETKQFNHANFNVYRLKEHYDAVCSLVSTCERLKSFSLRSWPARKAEPDKNEILEALCANEHNKKLRKLHMFWPDRTEKNWVGLRTNQTKKHALVVVEHFTALTHLSLPSNMISQDLLDQLAKGNRARLENMRVLVVFSNSDDNLQIPRLSWGPLHRACPELEVEVVFNSRVPEFNMAQMLKSEMPVSVLYFMKYARLGADDINAMAVKYQKTLKKFISYSDDTLDADVALLSLVVNCTLLHTLIFYGPLNFKTVMELAESKGKKWYQFVVKNDTIDLKAKKLDPDLVLGYDDATGQYYQADMVQWGDTDKSLKEKEERFKVMVESVTESIGRSWKPFSEPKST